MAADDKKHQKMLKEADKAFQKNYKLLKSGKITKDEFKKRILPYKEELIELGYPIKSSKEEKTEEKEGKTETEEVEEETLSSSEATEKPRIKIHPWKKKSNLTIEEIEDRIDEFTLGKGGTEGLKALYQAKYGEELAPPEEDIHLLPMHSKEEDKEEKTTSEEEEPEEIEESAPKKGLLRSVFKRSGGGD